MISIDRLPAADTGAMTRLRQRLHNLNHPRAAAGAAMVASLVVAPAAAVRAQQPSAPSAAPSPAPPVTRPLYRLAPGDTLDVKFEVSSELNETVKVRPDGLISLPRIGEVLAEGLTPNELTGKLQQAYAEKIRNPTLTVIVRDFVAQQVFIGGEVVQPGVVPLRGEITSLQAILSTGGLRPTARTSEVILIRHVSGNQAEVSTLDLNRVMKGQIADTILQPFDVVFVPRSKIAKADLFVEQYINSLIPRALAFVFPYNLNTQIIATRPASQ